MGDKNHDRALRYRRLALAELNKDNAALLRKIADEAERGVLCMVDEKQPVTEVMSAKPWTGASGARDQILALASQVCAKEPEPLFVPEPDRSPNPLKIGGNKLPPALLA